MEGIRKFYPTWRLSIRLGATYTLAIIACTLLVQEIIPRLIGRGPQAAVTTVLARTATVTPFIMLALAGMFYGIGRWCPVKATVDGVVGSTLLGRMRFVRWKDINSVVPYNAGIRMLRLESASEVTFLTMSLDDLSDLRDFVSHHAGPDHPLSQWLGSPKNIV
jgi:hypothetical protein